MMVKLRFQAEFPVTFRARIIKFFFMNFQNMNLFPILIFEQGKFIEGYFQQNGYKILHMEFQYEIKLQKSHK